MKKTLSILLTFVMLLSITAGLNIQAYAKDIIVQAGTTTLTVKAEDKVVFTPKGSGTYVFQCINTVSGEDSEYLTLYHMVGDGNEDYMDSFYQKTNYDYINDKEYAKSTSVYTSLEKGEDYCIYMGSAHSKMKLKITHKDSYSFATDVYVKAKSKLPSLAYGKKYKAPEFKVTVFKREFAQKDASYKKTDLKLSSTTLRKATDSNYHETYDGVIKHSKKVSKNTKLKGEYYLLATFKLKDSSNKYFIPDCTRAEAYSSGNNLYSHSATKVTNKSVTFVYTIAANEFVKDGLLYSMDTPKTASVLGLSNKKLKNVKIKSKVNGAKVRNIGYFAFSKTKIKSASIPSTVTFIAYAAFADCNKLGDVKLPAKVKTIEGAAFAGCRSMKALSISKKNKYYKTTDGVLYTKKNKTLVQYPAGKKGKKYNVESKTKVIDLCAFARTKNLKKVYIPKSVKEIYGSAFNESSVTDIYYAGTKKQWKNIYYGDYGDAKFKVHYNASKLK